MSCALSVASALADNNLFYSDEWLTLNSYERAKGGWRSHISNDDFFLSPNGAISPTQELAAFQKLAIMALNDDDKTTLLCKYPARLAFLEKNGVELSRQKQACALTEVGKTLDSIKSVSLIFANGYFGNPASYYGHVLLKLNKQAEPAANDTGLLDTAINYGAQIPPHENVLVYISKGVFGFYRGSFQQNDFFLNTAQYADQESRDIWAYDLRLSQSQVKQLAARALELQNAEFDYYFFGDNCAHRVRDLLAEVTRQPIAEDNGLWFMPIQVLNGAARTATSNGQGLFKNIRFLSSARTKLHTILKTLSVKESAALEDILDGHPKPLQNLTKNRQKLILIAADIHLRKLIADKEAKSQNEEELSKLKKKRQLILLRLVQLQEIDANVPQPNLPRPPHESGRHGTAITISAIDSRLQGSGQALTVRPAYSDALSSDTGKVPDSTLHMANLKLKHFNEAWRLESFTFVEVENLRAAKIPSRFNPGRVWHLSAGLERFEQTEDAPLRGYFKVGIGRDYRVTKSINGYILALAHVNEKSATFDQLHAALRLGVIGRMSNRSKFLMSYSRRQKADGEWSETSKIASRTEISAYFDLEFEASKFETGERQVRIGLMRHF